MAIVVSDDGDMPRTRAELVARCPQFFCAFDLCLADSKSGKYLGWPVLSVDPSYLVEEGLDRIQALASRLFRMLTMTEQVVVLLDEFDEMGRDRARADELLSRFITTAMLPKLASINDQRKIVFLLATNYISGFANGFEAGADGPSWKETSISERKRTRIDLSNVPEAISQLVRTPRPRALGKSRKTHISGKTKIPLTWGPSSSFAFFEKILERAKGLEPSTPTLARSCSTTELHPHPRDWRRSLAGNRQSYAKCGP
jgi:hypothetical protein